MNTIVEKNNLLEQYERDGYVIIRNVVDPDLIAESIAHVEWLRKKFPDMRPEKFYLPNYIGEDPFWVRIVADDRLLDIGEQFVGHDIALFASHYIAKTPFDGQPVLWHQDGSYWPLEPMEVTTLWLAQDDSTPENGCMRVIPGSHHDRLLGYEELQRRTDIPNALDSGMDPELVDESQAVDIILNAGDVSIHHPKIIHGSKPNNSPRWRRGLTIRYIPTSTQVTKPNWPGAFLLRGQAVPGINEDIYQPWPDYVAGQHMPFQGCETWVNQRAKA